MLKTFGSSSTNLFRAGSARASPRAAPVRPQAFFSGLFGNKETTAKSRKKIVRPTVIPDPDYKLPAGFVGIAGLIAVSGAPDVASLFGVIGVFLAIQASRVKFRFEDEFFEVVVGEKDAEEETENAFVGGKNRWSYDSFVNWEFWWPGFPVLFYFKETQTRPEGQIHFFPIIFNGDQLLAVAKERLPKKATAESAEDE